MKLVLVHGSGGSGDDWYFQRRHFPDLDAIDLPGHPEGEPCPTVEAYVEWLRGYIRQRGYRDVVLGGHSLGGGIVQLYALKYPEDLKGLILVGTGARLRVAPANLAMVEENFEQSVEISVNFPTVPEDVKQQLRAKRRSVGPTAMKTDLLACDKFDIMERLGEIKLPTLVLSGTADVMTPPKYGQYLASHIAGAELVIIEGASHPMALEKPEEVNAAIAKFLERLAECLIRQVIGVIPSIQVVLSILVILSDSEGSRGGDGDASVPVQKLVQFLNSTRG